MTAGALYRLLGLMLAGNEAMPNLPVLTDAGDVQVVRLAMDGRSIVIGRDPGHD